MMLWSFLRFHSYFFLLTRSKDKHRRVLVRCRRMKNGVATFFGVAENGEAEKLMKKKWENRSKLLLTTCRVFGNTVTQPPRGGRPECQLEIRDDRTDQGLLLDEVDSARLVSRPLGSYCFRAYFILFYSLVLC